MTLIRSNAGKFLRLAVMVLLLSAATSAETPGWQKVAGGDGTVCSDGSAYSFYVHPGNYVQGYVQGRGRNLLIYFQGGGACWSGPRSENNPVPGFRKLRFFSFSSFQGTSENRKNRKPGTSFSSFPVGGRA